MTAAARFVGQRVARHEDARFLTGRGQYVDDIPLPGALHAAFARSDVARGGSSLSTRKRRRRSPASSRSTSHRTLLISCTTTRSTTSRRVASGHSGCLAEGDVRCVGEPIAMVIADSRYHAEDALDAIVVDIDVEEPVVDPVRALDANAPLVQPNATSNVYGVVPAAENGALEQVLASAPVVLTETFRQHRYSTVPMETRGILASWDRVREELTVWISTQGPHGVRGQMARVLGIEDSQVHVIMPDVGGAFGLKMHPHPEELATVVASKLLGRPVKWIQDRRENLIADEQARDDQATVTMAAAADGTLLGARVEFLEVGGAFPSPGWERGGLLHCAVPGPVSLAGLRGLGADCAHEHVRTRRVPRALDDRNGRARSR